MTVSYDLSGRTAIVTGGAGGIGRSICERLKTSDARVWSWDIDPVEQDGIASLAVDVANHDHIGGSGGVLAVEHRLPDFSACGGSR